MVFLFVFGLAALLALVSAVPSYSGGKGGNGIHLPIRRSVAGGLERRGSTGRTGLGDDADVCVACVFYILISSRRSCHSTYNVIVKVGSVETPVVLGK